MMSRMNEAAASPLNEDGIDIERHAEEERNPAAGLIEHGSPVGGRDLDQLADGGHDPELARPVFEADFFPVEHLEGGIGSSQDFRDDFRRAFEIAIIRCTVPAGFLDKSDIGGAVFVLRQRAETKLGYHNAGLARGALQ